MSKSTTRFTDFHRLASVGEPAATVVRLMMACNDLTLADDALAVWHGEHAAKRQRRQTGAKMYFVRLQIAHVFEALDIIEHIQKTPILSKAVAVCDHRTRVSFKKVSEFIGTDDYKRMLRVRNNITFHYDHKVVANALRASAEAHPDRPLAISMGDATLDWFFEPADRIIDRIVVRDIFGVAPDADVRAEVDKMVIRLQDICVMFADFAGHFIWYHASRR